MIRTQILTPLNIVSKGAPATAAIAIAAASRLFLPVLG
jgi:hypothetical protein